MKSIDHFTDPAKEPKVHSSVFSNGIALSVVRLPEAKRGFVLLPRRWVVERGFAWMARFRRLARDDERLPGTFAGFHTVALAILLLRKAADFAQTRNTL